MIENPQGEGWTEVWCTKRVVEKQDEVRERTVIQTRARFLFFFSVFLSCLFSILARDKDNYEIKNILSELWPCIKMHISMLVSSLHFRCLGTSIYGKFWLSRCSTAPIWGGWRTTSEIFSPHCCCYWTVHAHGPLRKPPVISFLTPNNVQGTVSKFTGPLAYIVFFTLFHQLTKGWKWFLWMENTILSSTVKPVEEAPSLEALWRAHSAGIPSPN